MASPSVVNDTLPKDDQGKDTLYYDGQCPLCLKEIHLLKQRCQHALNFIDVHRTEHQPGNPCKEVLLKRLHLQTGDGNWLIGLDANVRIWSYTAYGWLFKPLRWPVIRFFADFLYNTWADRRYQKRYECDRCTINE